MRRFAMILLVAVAVFSGSPTTSADVQCISSGDRTMNYDPWYGEFCGGWGNGCAECVNSEDGSSCITNGESCEPRPLNRT